MRFARPWIPRRWVWFCSSLVILSLTPSTILPLSRLVRRLIRKPGRGENWLGYESLRSASQFNDFAAFRVETDLIQIGCSHETALFIRSDGLPIQRSVP